MNKMCVSSRFTESNFVSMLLPLLRKNGIYEINENLLVKKLYYYYSNPEYRELFQDICKARVTLVDEVDIQTGLFQEKYFGGSIVWNSLNSNILHLCYDEDMDLSLYEEKLSEEGISLMHKMAEELAVRKKVENNSKNKMVIYGCNPNKNYTLVHGERVLRLLSWQLLTDGDIESIEYPDAEELKHCIFNSPDGLNEMVQLDNNRIANVSLTNASYAVMQGLNNGKITRMEIFTNLTDSYKLEQVSEIANKEYTTSENLLTKDEPYVRKLVLK